MIIPIFLFLFAFWFCLEFTTIHHHHHHHHHARHHRRNHHRLIGDAVGVDVVVSEANFDFPTTTFVCQSTYSSWSFSSSASLTAQYKSEKRRLCYWIIDQGTRSSRRKEKRNANWRWKQKKYIYIYLFTTMRLVGGIRQGSSFLLMDVDELRFLLLYATEIIDIEEIAVI